MPRIHERLVTAPEELLPYINNGTDQAIGEACELLNRFDPPPFTAIPRFLNSHGLSLLQELEVPTNEKCPAELLTAHEVGGPLTKVMGWISLSNMDLREEVSGVRFSLKNETGEGVSLEPHRDLLDGHAVLYNYDVEGEWHYILNGVRYKMNNNEMVILNGAAEWGDITCFLPGYDFSSDPREGFRQNGGVTMVHAIETEGFVSRKRILAYAEGPETTTTQIPPELPYWW